MRSTPSLWFLLRSKLAGKSAVYEFYLKGKRTLDIGCGEGALLAQDKKLMAGFDVNERAMKRLATQGFDTKVGNVTAFPYPDDSFEIAHCHHVIEHLPIEVAFRMLQEAARVLMPGGLLVLSSEVVTKRFWNTFEHVKPYPPGAVTKLIKETGEGELGGIPAFEAVGVYYQGRYHKNPILYALFFVIGFYTVIARREYYLVLRKK